MKTKQLKEILSRMNEDYDVVVTDIDGKGIAISGVYVNAPVVNIETRQEFPEGWYDANGEEIKQHGYKLCPDQNTYEDIEFYNTELFGGSVTVYLHIYDGYAEGHGLRVEYPKLSELTNEQICEIDDYLGGRIHDSGVIYPDDVLLKYGKIVSFVGLMDTTNGHDEELVRKINALWVERWADFEPVMKALYERDLNEITDHDAFLFDQWKAWPEYNEGCETKDWANYNKRALDDLKAHWNFHIENYLQHIADDKDLETIISFLRV